MPRRRIITAEEQDVYTRWRRIYSWTQRAGATSAVKRRTRQRERREGKSDVDQGMLDYVEDLAAYYGDEPQG